MTTLLRQMQQLAHLTMAPDGYFLPLQHDGTNHAPRQPDLVDKTGRVARVPMVNPPSACCSKWARIGGGFVYHWLHLSSPRSRPLLGYVTVLERWGG
jgi:signal transduction histidine kinase